MAGIVLRVRTGAMDSCAACWDFHRDEIVFSNLRDGKRDWTPLYIGRVLAHELTHAYCTKVRAIPSGEKATDLFMLTRLPLKYFANGGPSYLECSDKPFIKYPERVQALAIEAVKLRSAGMRRYIAWFEAQVNAMCSDNS
jgi:hypothetical protein